MNRRAFLRISAAAACSGALLRRVIAGQSNADAEAAALAQAREGIRRYRQSPRTVRVIDPYGQPVRGAMVHILQQRHTFRFGSNCFRWRDPANADLEAAYRSHFARLFNQATLGFYWAQYEPQRGQPQHALRDPVVDWCLEHGIACKGHPLVWANIDDPPWLPDEPAAIHQLSHDRVREIVGRFRGRIDVWDVVNEPSLLLWANTRYGAYAHSVGTHSFISQHLQTARQSNPDATLLVNEVLSPYPFHSTLDRLRDADGRPLYDGIGIQSHMHSGHWPLDRTRALCDRVASLEVPLHFSETSVLSGPRGDDRQWQPTTPELEEAQADYTAKFYTLLFGHPAVREISWWDLTDAGAWQNAPAGLLRADMTPKPAYHRLDHLINDTWRTRVDGRTDRRGEFRLRAFHGQYIVAAVHPNGSRVERTVDWSPANPRTAVLRFPGPFASRWRPPGVIFRNP
jgi:endo-1,4-beta-xylanase